MDLPLQLIVRGAGGIIGKGFKAGYPGNFISTVRQPAMIKIMRGLIGSSQVALDFEGGEGSPFDLGDGELVRSCHVFADGEEGFVGVPLVRA